MTGQELKHYRRQILKLSCIRLATELGVSFKTIYNWEKMPQVPRVVEYAIRELSRRMKQIPQTKTL